MELVSKIIETIHAMDISYSISIYVKSGVQYPWSCFVYKEIWFSQSLNRCFIISENVSAQRVVEIGTSYWYMINCYLNVLSAIAECFHCKVVSADELRDEEEYKEILEDMREEGGKFGMHNLSQLFCMVTLFSF